jgi:hypothetical protein
VVGGQDEMDSWWANFEATVSVQIQKNHQAELEELTGCNPILLRPLLSPLRIIPDSQSTDYLKHYTEMIEHLSTTLDESVEVKNVRANILDYVTDMHGERNSEKWKSYGSFFPKYDDSGAYAKRRLVLLRPHSPASSNVTPRQGPS